MTCLVDSVKFLINHWIMYEATEQATCFISEIITFGFSCFAFVE